MFYCYVWCLGGGGCLFVQSEGENTFVGGVFFWFFLSLFVWYRLLLSDSCGFPFVFGVVIVFFFFLCFFDKHFFA